MKFEDKSIIIDKFIELAKKSKLNSEQKKRIVHIIENLNETKNIIINNRKINSNRYDKYKKRRFS